MKAKVYVGDKSSQRLEKLKKIFGDSIIPQQSDKIDLKELKSENMIIVE